MVPVILRWVRSVVFYGMLAGTITIFMSFLDRFFGPTYEKELKNIKPIISHINTIEPEIEVLTNEELRARSLSLKEKAVQGVSLDELLPEAFALVRESAKRTLDQRHYDVQLIGGIILAQRKDY
jgi:preprotein translocase subunit SecA